MFSKSHTDSFAIYANENGRRLDVMGGWTPKAAEVLPRGEADGRILNYARGYREGNLDFLQDWPLRRLTILARTVNDLDPIYRLADTLEYLSLVTSDNPALDLARPPRLSTSSAKTGSRSNPRSRPAPR